MATIAHLRTSKKSHQNILYSFQVSEHSQGEETLMSAARKHKFNHFQVFKHVMIRNSNIDYDSVKMEESLSHHKTSVYVLDA